MILYIFNFRMNNFLKNIAILFTIIVVSSIILDKIYTYIHYNGAPRNIPDYIMSLKEKDSLDYAIFGSSRSLHNIDINLIEQETTKKGFNFGIPGSSVFEIKLSIQQIIKRKITKKSFPVGPCMNSKAQSTIDNKATKLSVTHWISSEE